MTCLLVNGNDLDSILGLTSALVSQIPSITAYEKNDIVITFNFEKNPSTPGSFQIKMKARNTAFVEVTGFLFQAAVPKVDTTRLNHNNIIYTVCRGLK